MGIWKSEQFIVEVSLGNAKSLDVNYIIHSSLKGAVYTILKERRRVPYTAMDIYRYNTSFKHQTTGAYCISESRMQEICVSGLDGGILSCYSCSKEGCLP